MDMKATELMIGDWVRVSDNETTQVTDIVTDHREVLYGVSCADGATYDAGDLQPIPLTAEIIDKNFPKGNDRCIPQLKEWYFSDDVTEMFKIMFHAINIDDYDKIGVAIKSLKAGSDLVMLLQYVHELQHALRLCGVEKEIIL